jgi:hypothetical protein
MYANRYSHHDIGLKENRHLFRRKLVQFVESRDHNVDLSPLIMQARPDPDPGGIPQSLKVEFFARVDLVERFGDGGSGCCRLLPRPQPHCLHLQCGKLQVLQKGLRRLVDSDAKDSSN